MQQVWVRALIVGAILVAGGIWVWQGKSTSNTLASAPAEAALAAPRPLQAVDAADAVAPAQVEVPWAEEATDTTPLLVFIQENTSPVGQQSLDSFRQDNAVVLVSLPPSLPADAPLRAWIQECRDYVKTLGTVIAVDLQDPQEQELFEFLEVAGLTPPVLASIALSGKVRDRLVGDSITPKQVIDLFAEVTGSCGIECENGCP